LSSDVEETWEEGFLSFGCYMWVLSRALGGVLFLSFRLCRVFERR
jgi:hypothetical protein